MQDKDDKSYLNIMTDSLRQKDEVLDQILAATQSQMELLKQEEIDFDAYDALVDEKTNFIDRLNSLDEGFDSLYNKLKGVLSTEESKTVYRTEILRMQELITSITEKSTAIQAAEARNKQMLEAGFATTRKQIRQSRTSSKAAMDYYTNMQQTNALPPQFLDSKK